MSYRCPNCKTINESAVYCRECGKKLDKNSQLVALNNRLSYIVMAILFPLPYLLFAILKFKKIKYKNGILFCLIYSLILAIGFFCLSYFVINKGGSING